MNLAPVTWAIGRPTIGLAATLAGRLHVYGRDRVPATGGCVVASNHFSWLDPAVLGAASPRVLYYMAKIEAHRAPGLGTLIRAFGCFPVRRGESDREAVRTMRRIVADGNALGRRLCDGGCRRGLACGRRCCRRLGRLGRFVGQRLVGRGGRRSVLGKGRGGEGRQAAHERDDGANFHLVSSGGDARMTVR